jgi:hypothetical protein
MFHFKELIFYKSIPIYLSKRIFAFVAFSCFYFYSHSQNNILQLDIKKDFGAKGDGKTNDQKAFAKAAAFICNRRIIINGVAVRGFTKLYIPPGIYIVGYQKNLIGKIDTTKNNYFKFIDDNYEDLIGCYQGAPAFIFKSNIKNETIKNVSIYGSGNKSIIKFKDSMYFGTFDPSTGEVPQNLNKYNRVEDNFNTYLEKPNRVSKNKKYERNANPYHVAFDTNPLLSHIPRAYVGDIFFFSKSSYYENISITNLVLDGNSETYILGGNVGLPAAKNTERYIETFSGGIMVYNMNGLLLENLTIKNFGLDGIQFRGNLTKDSMVTCHNIILKNVRCTKNGRGGLAVTNVNTLTAYNCNFDENATGTLQVNPGFGVDLEPESPPVCNTQFYNCTFLNNGGVAVGMGYPNEPTSYNHYFNHCTFLAANNNFAIVNASDRCIFDSCKIFGSVLDYGVKFNKNKPNLYKNCTFNDIYLGKEVASNNEFLWSCKKNSMLVNCTFTNTHTARVIYCASITESKTGKEIPQRQEMVIIKNCTFYNKNTSNKSFADKSEAAIFENNVFYYPSNKPFVIKCTNTPPFEMNIDNGKGLILK